MNSTDFVYLKMSIVCCAVVFIFLASEIDDEGLLWSSYRMDEFFDGSDNSGDFGECACQENSLALPVEFSD